MNLHDNVDPITVGALKEALKDVPDSMPVTGLDGHTGEADNISFYVETDPECVGCTDEPTLIVCLG